MWARCNTEEKYLIYLTSDLHGRFDLLKELLDKTRFSDDDFLFILGDVIDRGGIGGVDILKWLLLKSNVQLILGNHEAMLLSCSWLFEEVTDESVSSLDGVKLRALSVWKRNGNAPTVEALTKESPETRADILEYLRSCPLYETLDVGGRAFVLVHGGLGNFSKKKKLSEYTADELIWTRPSLDTVYSESFTTVVGHTPTVFYGEEYKGKMIKTDTFLNIDTGAARGLSPMLLRLDDMTEIYL